MPEVPRQILDIAERLRRNERLRRRSVETLLNWFDAARRGDVVVSKIRAALLSAGLETDPDFTQGSVNDFITFRLIRAANKAGSPTEDRKPAQAEPMPAATAEAVPVQTNTHSNLHPELEQQPIQAPASPRVAYQLLDVESHNLPVRQHIQRIAEGDYVLPEFQRTFVWDEDKILRLWDSLCHGYPVGQLMLWDWGETDIPMRSFGREQEAVAPRKGSWAIIDGQQRLTAVYLLLSGNTPLKFDLAKQGFTYSDGQNCLRLDVLRNAEGQSVEFSEAAGGQFFQIHSTPAQKKQFGKVIDYLNGILNQRSLPSQTIRRAAYGIVISAFRRLNEQGEPLNDAEIAMAGISEHWPGVFRRTYNLLHRMNVEMGYDRAEDPTFVLQVWAAVHTGQRQILNLAPDERSNHYRYAKPELYEESWRKTEAGISDLIEMMRTALDLTNFQFVRVSYPLAVVAHFLANHPSASDEDRNAIRRWLILSLVTGRYHERPLRKFGADIKATTSNSTLANLFSHRTEALDPRRVPATALSPKEMAEADFRSAYVTLLYLVVRRLGATDWDQFGVRVGNQLRYGPWQLHHIFPNDTFEPDRKKLLADLEHAEDDGDEEAVQRIRNELLSLNRKVFSLGNLAFLMPATNQKYGNKRPRDYLREIAESDVGKKALEAQMVPLDPQLWNHEAFDQFCARRCELLAENAKRLFFSA